MLDLKFIRENPELVKRGALKKHVECDVDRLLEVDAERRRLGQDVGQDGDADVLAPVDQGGGAGKGAPDQEQARQLLGPDGGRGEEVARPDLPAQHEPRGEEQPGGKRGKPARKAVDGGHGRALTRRRTRAAGRKTRPPPGCPASSPASAAPMAT